MKRIILASESPRRKELLENIGIKFVVEAAAIDESVFNSLDGRKMALELSRRKAGVVAAHHRSAIVIAADTVVILGDRVMGKPRDRHEAKQMLRALSGKPHIVVTAFTIIDTGTKKTVTDFAETTVYVKPLRSEDIDAYVRTGEPLGKAGAYAIQGIGSVIVEKIEGDYFNVVGLPLSKLADSLKLLGINVLQRQILHTPVMTKLQETITKQ
jgi:septum formation protein